MRKKRIKRKVHQLTADNIAKRKSRSWKLYLKLNNGRWKNFITTDESWLSIYLIAMEKEEYNVSMNEKNPEVEVFERREQHAKGFMLWAGISLNGKTDLDFVEPGAWKKLPQELINKALEAWPKHVHKIYKAKVGYNENSK